VWSLTASHGRQPSAPPGVVGTRGWKENTPWPPPTASHRARPSATGWRPAVAPADYRAAVEELLAAGVTGHAALAAALNADPRYTPPGTAWDGAAVERLLRSLRLRPSGRAPTVPGVSYRPAQARPFGAPVARAGPIWS
jgi:hypothetical protein